MADNPASVKLRDLVTELETLHLTLCSPNAWPTIATVTAIVAEVTDDLRQVARQLAAHDQAPAPLSCAAAVDDWGPHDFRRMWRISGSCGVREVCDVHLPPFLEDTFTTPNTVVCIHGGGGL